MAEYTDFQRYIHALKGLQEDEFRVTEPLCQKIQDMARELAKDAFQRPKFLEILSYKGGWEGWLQVELAYYLRQKWLQSPQLELHREINIYPEKKEIETNKKRKMEDGAKEDGEEEDGEEEDGEEEDGKEEDGEEEDEEVKKGKKQYADLIIKDTRDGGPLYVIELKTESRCNAAGLIKGVKADYKKVGNLVGIPKYQEKDGLCAHIFAVAVIISMEGDIKMANLKTKGGCPMFKRHPFDRQNDEEFLSVWYNKRSIVFKGGV